MSGGSGGSGSGGRSGGGGGSTNGDAGQPGEVVSAAEEAKLQARVDNMNNLVGKLNAEIKRSEQNIAQMTEVYSKNLQNYAKRSQAQQLAKNIRAEQKKNARTKRRMVNIYDRMNKIIDENS